MNALELRLNEINPGLLSKLNETIIEVDGLLLKFDSNFPTYTDHSIKHTKEVFKLASELLTKEEILNLNEDEIYILSMACYLHDIGMCIPENKIKEIGDTDEFLHYKKAHPNLSIEEYVRNIHHELSNKFIVEEWQALKIPSIKYAKAIGLVAQGHRVVDLGDSKIYDPKFFVKNGRDFVCLPYLASILRIADELDITNIRTPQLLTKYYMPNNEVSVKEWKKHIATTQINFAEDQVLYEVVCTDQNILAALEEQFEKIQNVIKYCQKVIRTISNTEDRKFTLNLITVKANYEFRGFDPKGIKFSFDVPNVINAFVGEDLYKNKLTAIREVLQNSIDSCRYKKTLLGKNYDPSIIVTVEDSFIKIEDNGLGMDEFIIENFFGKLGSSYYEQEKVKNEFEAIGQFGVGVFSYFLLAEYIYIETKKGENKTLKFMIDKDPKSYFHFYDKTEREEEGTTIILNFKKELTGKYSFEEIEEYINNVFRYIEFSIKLICKNSVTKISKRKININLKEELTNYLKPHYLNKIENYQSVSVYLKNEEYEGECCLIIKKYSKGFQLSGIHELEFREFKNETNYISSGRISFSQKGVFVNNHTGELLSYIVGNINIIEKKKINISRNEFSDSQSIEKIIIEFEVKIIDKLFDDLINRFKKEDLYKLSYQFLEQGYLHKYSIRFLSHESEELKIILGKIIFLKVFHKGIYSIITLKELVKKYKDFVLISESENLDRLIKRFSKPLVIFDSYGFGMINTIKDILIHFFDFKLHYDIFDDTAFMILTNSEDSSYTENRKKILQLLLPNNYQFIPIESGIIATSIYRNRKGYHIESIRSDIAFNLNHPFFYYVIKYLTEINETNNCRHSINAAIGYIRDLIGVKNIDIKDMKELNEMLAPLNAIQKPPKFSLKDFPIEESTKKSKVKVKT